MSDGSRFTAIAQSINEAKRLVDYFIDKNDQNKFGDIV